MRCFFIRLVIVFGLVAVAGGPAPVSAADALADLAESDTWRQLVRYKPSLVPGMGVRSDIVTDGFFLSERGAGDPAAELEATLDALSMTWAGRPDDRPLCRYPARAMFLERELGLGLPDPLEACPSFRAFAQDGEVKGASLLFISGYLSNPGSAFGHLLLRLHTDEEPGGPSDVLDRAINYGAAASEEDPLIPYIAKGLTGRYRSTFSTLEFFHHAERYREAQLRTIWEYRIDLDQDEVDFLTAHLWELQETENRYYFLRQNCAYRMGEVLELVVDRDLIPDTKFWVAPIDVFHSLAGNAADGGEAVAAVRRLASREALFLEGYAALTAPERRYVDAVVAGRSEPIHGHEEHAALADPAPAYDVLLDHYAYNDATDELKARRREVLRARLALPPSPPREDRLPPPPHEGQRPSLVQVSALFNDALGEGAEVRLRPAYFDFLSNTKGTVPYSELSMADVRVVIRDDAIDLRRLDAVKVTSLKVKTADSPAAGGTSWRVRMGAEDKDLACDDCLLGFAEFGAGRARELARGVAAYGLVGGRVEAGRNADSHLYASAASGLIIRGQRVALAAEVGILQGLDEDDETRPYGQADLRLGSGRRWDVRVGTAWNQALESRVSVGFYW